MKNCCWHKKEWSEMEKMEELKNLLTANVNKVTELLHKKEKEEIMEEKKKIKSWFNFCNHWYCCSSCCSCLWIISFLCTRLSGGF